MFVERNEERQLDYRVQWRRTHRHWQRTIDRSRVLGFVLALGTVMIADETFTVTQAGLLFGVASTLSSR